MEIPNCNKTKKFHSKPENALCIDALAIKKKMIILNSNLLAGAAVSAKACAAR